jgi:prolyl 3-hydroxylase /prolyl 3,4-dihydroxylase
MIEYSNPFYHCIIDNFLPDDIFLKVKETYSKLLFKEIKSDLFNFLQTNELNCNPQLQEFKSALDQVFIQKMSLDGRYYDIFGSYYRERDFLLCHDDLIDNREYAFTFYLDDYDSGQLIIYENDGITANKLVKVCANRLVIFKVSELSYHEVSLCEKNGRKAISGWINKKNKKAIIKKEDRSLFIPENIEYFDLDLEETPACLDYEDVKVAEVQRTVSGKFVDRRCTKIDLEVYYIPKFEGYTLIHAEYLFIDNNGYILCNDRINIKNENTLDVLIVRTEGLIENYFKFVNEEGNTEFELDAIDGNMFIIKREKTNICIQRLSGEVYLKHFIYKKND